MLGMVKEAAATALRCVLYAAGDEGDRRASAAALPQRWPC